MPENKVKSFDVEMSKFLGLLTDPRKNSGTCFTAVLSSSLDFNKEFNVKYDHVFSNGLHWSYYVVLWGSIKPTTLSQLVVESDVLLTIRLTRRHLELEPVEDFPPLKTVFNRRFSFDFENKLEKHEADFYFGVGMWIDRKNREKEKSNKRKVEEIIDVDELDCDDTEYIEIEDPQDFATWHRLNKSYLD